jgi:RimJ/RimL family protein N-acetyltransferase
MSDLPAIVLPHCTLRPWRRDDRVSLVTHANNPNVSRWLSHEFPHPYGEAEADAWFDLVERRDLEQAIVAAIEVDGAAVGGIGIKIGVGVFERSGELGNGSVRRSGVVASCRRRWRLSCRR